MLTPATPGIRSPTGLQTPQNSCSAVLTENRDKYFVSHKPAGAPATIFSLAYKPHDFAEAKQRYDEWTAYLVQNDYPVYFGTKKNEDDREVECEAAIQSPEPPSATRRKAPSRQGYESLGISPLLSHPELPTLSSGSVAQGKLPRTDSLPSLCLDLERWLGSDIRAGQLFDGETVGHLSPPQKPSLGLSDHAESSKTRLPTPYDGDPEADIPRSVYDVVEVRTSTIPNAGRGVFAKRKVPRHAILGYYFGVPLTEDEFDCLKEKVGQASQYAVGLLRETLMADSKWFPRTKIRYKFTVLDATDENGEPFAETVCPFHFINEDCSRVNVAFREGAQVNQIYVLATRDIEADDEIFVSYGTEVDRTTWHANS